MAAKIGILGETTSVAVSTITVYTVPADKAARVRILWACELTSSLCRYGILVGTPGVERQIANNVAGNIDFWSGMVDGTTIKSGDIAVQRLDAGTGSWIESSEARGIFLPYPHDFYLSTGDTVRVIVGTNALADHLVQVIGVEDDA